MCANFTEWLDGVEAKKTELELTAPPAFLSSTVTEKLDPIETEVRKLIRKPKPKPPKVSANATKTNSNSSSAEKGSEGAADGGAKSEAAEDGKEKADKEEGGKEE